MKDLMGRRLRESGWEEKVGSVVIKLMLCALILQPADLLGLLTYFLSPLCSR